MKSYYHYMQKHRHGQLSEYETVIALYMFKDVAFPRHSTVYDEISRYFEMADDVPFSLLDFERSWSQYVEEEQ